jgi:nitrogenase molybdenum-iron protein alpha/beta subunit
VTTVAGRTGKQTAKRTAYVLQVHKITVATTSTGALIELAAACVREVCHRTKLRRNDAACIITPCHGFEAALRLFFFVVFNVDVPKHVIPQILHCVKLFHLAKFLEFFKQLFKEFLKMFLGILCRLSRGGIWSWRNVQVRDHQSL